MSTGENWKQQLEWAHKKHNNLKYTLTLKLRRGSANPVLKSNKNNRHLFTYLYR